MKRAYPFLLVILSGVLFSLAWPQSGFPVLLFVAFIPLFSAQEHILKTFSKSAGAKVWALSYLAFVIWNLLTTWWVYNSSPEGSYMAVGCNSLFMSWVYYFAFLMRKRLGKQLGYISLVAAWLMFEYFHMNWKLSWPWLSLGNGFAAYAEWVQWYEFTGVLGGSLWVLLVNVLLFEAMQSLSVKKVLVPILAVVAPIAVSYLIYFTYSETENPVQVVVVQPNIDPYNEKFANGTQQAQFDKLLRLAKSKTSPETDYIVFPETAIPGSIWDNEMETDPQFLALRDFLAASPKAKIVLGGTYLEMFIGIPKEQLPSSVSRYGKTEYFYDDYNAAFQIDTSSYIPVYKKSKLVPGPESYPLPDFMKPMQEMMFSEIGGMMGNLGTQKERSVFYAPDRPQLAVAPIICYESIYGEFVTEYVQKGAKLLFIITNDGWWGETPGYKQHFQYARLRAIETRRSIARSANTGISGFINQRGDVLAQTPYWQEAAISGTINANDSQTFYTRYGDYLGRAAALLTAAIFLYFIYVLLSGKRKDKGK